MGSPVTGVDTTSFHAMGSPCRVVTVGGSPDILAECRQLIEHLEASWSRFLPGSEISKANTNAGHVTILSQHTYSLVEHAVAASEATAGRFNPLMLNQIQALGYDKSWDQCSRTPTAKAVPALADGAAIELLPMINGVRIPDGCGFDPGGIGKGLATDLVTDLLTSRGVCGSSVELGGDLRVQGQPWYGSSWRIGIAHPVDASSEIAAFTPTAGAVATSSRLRRHWAHGTNSYHHLLDPRTGAPARTDLVSASSCAATAWWAEVSAKVVLTGGSLNAVEQMKKLNTPGIAVTAEGEVLQSGQKHPCRTTRESLTP